MAEDCIKLEISKNEAIILWDFFSKIESSEEYETLDLSEQIVIWNILYDLGEALPGISSEYQKIVDIARKKINEEHTATLE